jgi:hypothetical protein
MCPIDGLVVTSRGSCAPGITIAYRRGPAATSVAKHGERVTRKVLSQEIDQGRSQEQIRHDIEPQRTDADQKQDRSKDADIGPTSPAEDQYGQCHLENQHDDPEGAWVRFSQEETYLPVEREQCFLSESDVPLRICDHQESMHDEPHHAEESPNEEPRPCGLKRQNTATTSTKMLQTTTLVTIGPPFAASSLPGTQLSGRVESLNRLGTSAPNILIVHVLLLVHQSQIPAAPEVDA